MSRETTSTDSDINRCSSNVIKSVSILLSEIINENKEELKNMKKDSLGILAITQISISLYLIQRNLLLYLYITT